MGRSGNGREGREEEGDERIKRDGEEIRRRKKNRGKTVEASKGTGMRDKVN